MCKGENENDLLYVLCCSVVFALALVLLDYEYHATLQTTITKIGTDGPGTTECFFCWWHHGVPNWPFHNTMAISVSLRWGGSP